MAVRLASTFTNKPLLKHSERIVTAAPQQTYKPKTIFRRPLDGLECLSHEYYKRGIKCSYGYASLRSKVPLKKEIVRQALAILSHRHPLLKANVFDPPNSNEKYFECIHGYKNENVHLRVMDRDVDEETVVTEELMASMGLRNDPPIWETILLKEKFDYSTKCYRNALIMIFSHSIVNGGCLLSLYDQLLGYIEAITGGALIKEDDVKAFPLLPSSSRLLSHKLTMFPKSAKFSLANDVPEDFIHPVLSDFPTIEYSDGHQNVKPYTKVLLRTVPNEDLAKLILTCRQHNSTLTGAFQAACHMALCGLLKTRPLSSNLTVDMTCIVSTLKDHCPSLPTNYLTGSYGVVNTGLPLTTDYKNFWEISSSCTKSIQSSISACDHLEYISALNNGWESILRLTLSQAKTKLANRQQPGHLLSNATSFNIQNDKNNTFHLENIFAGSPTHVRSGTFGNFIGSVNGKLSWMTTYDGSVISTEMAERYYSHIGEILENMVVNFDVN